MPSISKQIVSPNSYRCDGRKVLFRGESFPLQIDALVRGMQRRGYGLEDQLRYLHLAEEAFMVAHPSLLDAVDDLIAERQEWLDRITRSRQRTVALLEQVDAVGPIADDGVAERGDEVAAAFAATAPTHCFYWRHRQTGTEWAHDLQRNLWQQKLLLPPADTAPDKVHDLPLALGVGRSGATLTRRMVWLGNLNQLHYLVNRLLDDGYVGCAAAAKWRTAADLFVPPPPRRPFTAKNLSDARDIKDDDQRRVAACIPVTLCVEKA